MVGPDFLQIGEKDVLFFDIVRLKFSQFAKPGQQIPLHLTEVITLLTLIAFEDFFDLIQFENQSLIFEHEIIEECPLFRIFPGILLETFKEDIEHLLDIPLDQLWSNSHPHLPILKFQHILWRNLLYGVTIFFNQPFTILTIHHPQRKCEEIIDPFICHIDRFSHLISFLSGPFLFQTATGRLRFCHNSKFCPLR